MDEMLDWIHTGTFEEYRALGWRYVALHVLHFELDRIAFELGAGD